MCRMRCFILLLSAWASSSVALTLCHEDQRYPPYVEWDAASPNVHGGIAPELVRLAGAEIGEPIKMMALPWKRCVQFLQEGEVDGAFMMIWTPERDGLVAFPKARDDRREGTLEDYRMWRAKYAFFVSRQGAVTWDGKQVMGKVHGFAAPAGYVAQQQLEAAGLLAPGTIALDTGLRLVAMDRLDGYVVEAAVGLLKLKALGLEDKIEMLPIPYVDTVEYVPLSLSYYRQNPERAWAFWRALAHVRDTQGPVLMKQYLPNETMVP